MPPIFTYNLNLFIMYLANNFYFSSNGSVKLYLAFHTKGFAASRNIMCSGNEDEFKENVSDLKKQAVDYPLDISPPTTPVYYIWDRDICKVEVSGEKP